MLGRQNGFYDDSNVEESFLVDWALETSLDLQTPKPYLVQMKDEPDEESFNKAKEVFEKFNGQIAGMLTKNNTTYFAGERLTIADFVILCHYLSFTQNPACEKPITQAHAATAASTPVVGEYCERVKAQVADYIAN